MSGFEHPLNQEAPTETSATENTTVPLLDPETLKSEGEPETRKEEGKEGGDGSDELKGLLEDVRKQLQESQKFNGRLTNELGELRKENRELRESGETPRQRDPGAPKMPKRDDFESEEDYEDAMGEWAVERNRYATQKEQASNMQAKIQKAWEDTGWDQDTIDSVLDYWRDPDKATPQNLRRAMEMLEGTRESRLEAIEKMMKELQRGGAPSSSGIGDSHRQDVGEGEVGSEEATSFARAMSESDPVKHERMVDRHVEKFGRFIKPS